MSKFILNRKFGALMDCEGVFQMSRILSMYSRVPF